MAQNLALTAAHIARIHRTLPDTGPVPGTPQQTDADYDTWVARILATHPAPDRPTQLFAYGSLIWNPAIPHITEQPGTALGWHRKFCLRQTRFRGTPENPGLMMALDRGGACRGVLFALAPNALDQQLNQLFRREFTVKPITNIPRWITVRSASGPIPALAFVINRASSLYAGSLSPAEVTDILAHACGHLGSGAEYLLNTVTHLEARGIHDQHLWQLQHLVAARIERG